MKKIIEAVDNSAKSILSLAEQIKTVNALGREVGCVDGTIIGTGRSDYTQSSTVYDLTVEGKTFALIDIPGIEGNEKRFEETIKNSLETAHTIFYVNGSGKKIEKKTLEKIKKYMRDGTSVYAVFNTHCKPKKNRDPKVDKSYSQELEKAYEKQKEIIDQTEKELKSILERNYKGSINLNGLLAFCAVAFDEKNRTTIKDEKDKGLRDDQNKYFNEYSGNREQMLEESRLNRLRQIIEGKIGSFDSEIEKENIKKLKSRMNEILKKIGDLKRDEFRKIEKFFGIYDEYEIKCRYATNDYIRAIGHAASGAVEVAFQDLKDELFERIEEDNGKTKQEEIEEIVKEYEDPIKDSIKTEVEKRINEAQKQFEESIKEAANRLTTDIKEIHNIFEVDLLKDNIVIDPAFMKAFKYSWKSFGKDVFRVAELALDGAMIGSVIPGLGTIAGVIIGVVVGICLRIWNWFVGKKVRINKAKTAISESLDNTISELSEKLNEEIEKTDYKTKINGFYASLCAEAEKQKKTLESVKRLLNTIEREMKKTDRNIA